MRAAGPSPRWRASPCSSPCSTAPVVNVALPSLAVELGASTRQLQWIVDAYLLVFTGLLLAAGGLGDRYGRKRILIAGLVAFGATSAFAGSVDAPGTLILGRALMGVGAALIFPATLAILTNVFRDPRERAAAIGVWSAVSGIAVAAGPITGGWLLQNFWWGSVFYINVPVTAVVALAAWRLSGRATCATTWESTWHLPTSRWRSSIGWNGSIGTSCPCSPAPGTRCSPNGRAPVRSPGRRSRRTRARGPGRRSAAM
jgi:MFS family permease